MFNSNQAFLLVQKLKLAPKISPVVVVVVFFFKELILKKLKI
jgi:hypothetical protein